MRELPPQREPRKASIHIVRGNGIDCTAASPVFFATLKIHPPPLGEGLLTLLLLSTDGEKFYASSLFYAFSLNFIKQTVY